MGNNGNAHEEDDELAAFWSEAEKQSNDLLLRVDNNAAAPDDNEFDAFIGEGGASVDLLEAGGGMPFDLFEDEFGHRALGGLIASEMETKGDDDCAIPILGLMDCDPHGIDIFFVYRFGSQAMQFDAGNLVCPTMRLIGLRPCDKTVEIAAEHKLRLSTRDRKKAVKMLQRAYVASHPEYKREISKMLHDGIKYEIQAVDIDLLTTVHLPMKVGDPAEWI
ncbi:endodeoxyribonuclease [Irineochytrium annulatum]|nr:endodeoxyribonuclease [Irineochytrium annulatum]